MKRKFLTMAIAAISVSFFSACSNNSSSIEGGEDALGQVAVNYSFEQTMDGKATQSTAKPSTDWTNVNDLMILFVDQVSSQVKAARVLTPPSTGALATQHTEVLSNVPAGTYDAYLIANYNESNITRTNASGAAWNEGNVVGQNISALTLKLAANSEFTARPTESGSVGYQQPSEIFLNKQTVTVTADANVSATFALARVVSLFRVRIDQSNNGNDVVDFSTTNSDFRLRKMPITYNPKAGFAATVAATDVLYSKGAFLNANPTSGYTAGTILDAANNLKLWKDYVIFPGGSATEGNKKFDIVISGMAPVGYLPFGATTALTVATKVYWSGQVQAAITSNNILEVNLVLMQAGKTEVPEIGNYGNVNITVGITGWGNISSTDLEV